VQDADRFTFMRARRAVAARDAGSAGTAAPRADVHFVRRLTAKRGVRQHVVVFVDVKRHQSPDRRGAVERVEEEPLVFQRTPPRFDRRVREFQLRERQQTAEDARLD
jgi:hypothetical protein